MRWLRKMRTRSADELVETARAPSIGNVKLGPAVEMWAQLAGITMRLQAIEARMEPVTARREPSIIERVCELAARSEAVNGGQDAVLEELEGSLAASADPDEVLALIDAAADRLMIDDWGEPPF